MKPLEFLQLEQGVAKLIIMPDQIKKKFVYTIFHLVKHENRYQSFMDSEIPDCVVENQKELVEIYRQEMDKILGICPLPEETLQYLRSLAVKAEEVIHLVESEVTFTEVSDAVNINVLCNNVYALGEAWGLERSENAHYSSRYMKDTSTVLPQEIAAYPIMQTFFSNVGRPLNNFNVIYEQVTSTVVSLQRDKLLWEYVHTVGTLSQAEKDDIQRAWQASTFGQMPKIDLCMSAFPSALKSTMTLLEEHMSRGDAEELFYNNLLAHTVTELGAIEEGIAIFEIAMKQALLELVAKDETTKNAVALAMVSLISKD